jgi:D-inositol-3-phosphate glycosyltransferase
VDLSVIRPRDQGAARDRLGLPRHAHVLLFAGRIQPLKAPDVLLHAAAALLDRDPGLRSRLVVPVVGGPSGSGLEHPDALAQLAARLGVDDVVRFVPPVAQTVLADWYAAATLVCVPSYNESFGLVAVEAQATGTPVVAAAVGGLTTIIEPGVTGELLDSRAPAVFAAAVDALLAEPERAAAMGEAAAQRARGYTWSTTAARLRRLYTDLATRVPVSCDG